MTASRSSRLLKNCPQNLKLGRPFTGRLMVQTEPKPKGKKIMIYAQQIENEILGGAILAHRPSKTFFNWRTTDGKAWPVTVRQATARRTRKEKLKMEYGIVNTLTLEGF